MSYTISWLHTQSPLCLHTKRQWVSLPCMMQGPHCCLWMYPWRSTSQRLGSSRRSYEGKGPFVTQKKRRRSGRWWWRRWRGRRRRAEGAGPLGRGFPHISSLHRQGARRAGDGPAPAARECRGGRGAAHFPSTPSVRYFSSFFFSNVLVYFSPLPHSDHALAEVVVCAVSWVVTLPAMEMTAQATALLVLVPPLQPRIKASRSQRRFTV